MQYQLTVNIHFSSSYIELLILWFNDYFSLLASLDGGDRVTPYLLHFSPLDPFRGSSWWESVTNTSRVTRTLGSSECLFVTVFSSSWYISFTRYTNHLNFIPTIAPYLPVESFHCSYSLKIDDLQWNIGNYWKHVRKIKMSPGSWLLR